ncbi:Glyoxalase-like domain protein [Roseovarius albus]|uniref:Glyoxalase-like domain protein n=1 Tax=Roseovarius albus TaxID=1247867 RepID=A0A1X6ZA31_9RHOB|nr:VOC family protein [Roseovarius albus]SLN45515.1 Glyoxalase-like domain protein [Roseovarius albus]
MEQRVSLITLGVADLERSTRFYEVLGWKRVESPDGVIAFDLIGQTLGLYPRMALAAELGVAEADLGTGAVTLAHNLRSRRSVKELMASAEAAGARIVKPPQEVFWGGFHGYFADPDGHIWEIAHNPFSALRTDGAFRWNGY